MENLNNSSTIKSDNQNNAFSDVEQHKNPNLKEVLQEFATKRDEPVVPVQMSSDYENEYTEAPLDKKKG